MSARPHSVAIFKNIIQKKFSLLMTQKVTKNLFTWYTVNQQGQKAEYST